MDNAPLSSEKEAPPRCRMCQTESTFFHRDKKRAYYQCPVCQMVFVPPEYMLSAEDEKAEYDLHDNVTGDCGYEKFLSRAANPVIEYFSKQQKIEQRELPVRGLDFGSGPGTVLANMLSASPHSFAVDSYDLFYFPQNVHFLERSAYYDFITATEVVEHLASPLTVLRQLWNCLLPDGGILVIMTKRVAGKIELFRNWHYIRDPTHISFFHEATFSWLANELSKGDEMCVVNMSGPDVVILQKQRKLSSA